MSYYDGKQEDDFKEEEVEKTFGEDRPKNYNYSWNSQDPIYPKEKKNNKKGIFKILAGAFVVVFGISVISLAVYGGYEMLNELNNRAPQDPVLSTQKPSMEITDIPDYQKINNPEVLEGQPLTAVQVVEKVTPSVVGVVGAVSRNGFAGKSTGSGVIMTTDGYVVTNAHVIEGATGVSVVFADNSSEPATVIGYDAKSDLAVLKIERKDLTAAEFGNSDNLKVGESVIAIGNPLGLELFGTAVGGMISATNRDVTIEDRVMTLLQTSAPINGGNSGGALVNMYGQVIGINSAKISGTGVEGISFAIPINSAKPMIDNLLQYGYVKDRPLIGISGEDISERTAVYYDIPQGVLVRTVTPGSGAEKAGIISGDIVVKLNGVLTANMTALNAEKDKYKAGDEVEMTIYRDGKTFTAKVALMEDKPEANG